MKGATPLSLHLTCRSGRRPKCNTHNLGLRMIISKTKCVLGCGVGIDCSRRSVERQLKRIARREPEVMNTEQNLGFEIGGHSLRDSHVSLLKGLKAGLTPGAQHRAGGLLPLRY